MTGTSRIQVPKRFRVIAHRGASGYAPENTIAAFRLAADMGVREIEFDVRLSRDGKLVVAHDPSFDRLGIPGAVVADMTLAELRELDLGQWFGDGRFAGERIVTVEEIFRTFGDRFIYHAEIKVPSSRLAELLIAEIDRFAFRTRTIVTSFDFDVLAEIRELAPEQRVGWLVRDRGLSETNIDCAAAMGFFQFCPRANETESALVAAAKQRIAEVRAHGIKEKSDLRRAVAAGCDGATLNWPDWAVAA